MITVDHNTGAIIFIADRTSDPRYATELYAARTAWKFGYPDLPGAHSEDGKRCLVCGSPRREHTGTSPALYCPVTLRLDTAPPVPLALERAVIMHASDGKVDAYQRPPARRKRSIAETYAALKAELVA